MNKAPLLILALVTILCICLACAPSATTSKSSADNAAAAGTAPVTTPGSTKSTTKKSTPAATTAPKSNLPIINSFSVDPAIINEGDLTNIKWQISNATSVSISPTIGAVDLIGSMRVFPATSTAYTLTASNSSGAVSAVATVMVEKPYSSLLPVILSFNITPRIISENDTCEISWNIHGATSVSLEYGSSSKTATVISTRLTPTGKMTLTPKYELTSAQQRDLSKIPITISSTNYIIKAINIPGTTTVSTEVTVLKTAIIPKPGIPIAYDNMTVIAATVLPIIRWFNAEPYSIIQGNTTTLTWEVAQATKVVLNGVQVPLSGSQIVSPAGNTSYTLSASNEYWTSTKAVTVNVLSYKPEWFLPVIK